MTIIFADKANELANEMQRNSFDINQRLIKELTSIIMEKIKEAAAYGLYELYFHVETKYLRVYEIVRRNLKEIYGYSTLPFSYPIEDFSEGYRTRREAILYINWSAVLS